MLEEPDYDTADIEAACAKVGIVGEAAAWVRRRHNMGESSTRRLFKTVSDWGGSLQTYVQIVAEGMKAVGRIPAGELN